MIEATADQTVLFILTNTRGLMGRIPIDHLALHANSTEELDSQFEVAWRENDCREYSPKNQTSFLSSVFSPVPSFILTLDTSISIFSMKGLANFENCRKEGKEFDLPDNVWHHIRQNHPEIQLNHLKQILRNPDAIVRSNWDEASQLYYKKIGKYYKAVVVEREQKRVKTTLTTNKVKTGEVLWKKKQ